MKFPVILADPPVPFETWGKRPGGIDSRAAEAHYSTIDVCASRRVRRRRPHDDR